jgi:outer membrane protein assembly factor BamB
LTTDVEVVTLAVGSGKTGTVIAADAGTGRIIWQTAVGRHENDELTELPVGEVVEVYPGNLGGIETPTSYANGTIFVPVVNLSTMHTATGFVPGSGDLSRAKGELVALDVLSGRIKWTVDLPQGPFGGTAVANDVVFVSTLDGVFAGYSTKTGAKLWSYQATCGINAPPAIAGDLILVAAAGPLIPGEVDVVPEAPDPADIFGANPAATPEALPSPVQELIAFRLKQSKPSPTPETNYFP